MEGLEVISVELLTASLMVLLGSILKRKKQNSLFASLTALYPTAKADGLYGFFHNEISKL